MVIRRRSSRRRWAIDSAPHDIDGFIGEGTSLSGNFTLRGGFRVDGRLSGRVASSTLIVGPPARLDVDELRVERLIVHGHVRGTIHVGERLEIHPGGRVEGTVHLAKPALAVAPEGKLDGTIVMPDDDGAETASVHPGIRAVVEAG